METVVREQKFTGTQEKPLTLSFLSHRVRIPGSVNNHSVPEITVDTASDVSDFSKTSLCTQKVPSKSIPTSAHVVACS